MGCAAPCRIPRRASAFHKGDDVPCHHIRVANDVAVAVPDKGVVLRVGVGVSVKSACSTDGTPSKAVFAVSRDRKNALSSWRISLSHLTTEEELNGFLAAFDRCLKDLQKEK